MMIKNRVIFFVFSLILLFGFYKPYYVIDEVLIGNQTWMTKNLNVEKFRNGDIIPRAYSLSQWTLATENKTPAWCYYNNESSNGVNFGRIYNWYAVKDKRGLAPEGWHIPSNVEWEELIKHFGEDQASYKLKSNSSWDYCKGSNESGFDGLASGYLMGQFGGMGIISYWWTSTEDGSMHINIVKIGCDKEIERGGYYIQNGYAVRCIKD